MKELQWGSPKWAAINLIIACICVGTGKLSDTLAVVRSLESAVWAPSALMVAAVLIFGCKIFVGIILGTIGINVWYFHGKPPQHYLPASLAFSGFSLIESLSCGWLLRHPLQFKNGRICWKVGHSTLFFFVIHFGFRF